MTREEAIEVLKDIYNYTRFDTYTTNEARTMAIKALENKPRFLVHSDGKIEQIIETCDDCVSRSAVLDYIDKILNCGMGKKKSFEFIRKFVEKLSSVTPKRKQGEWILDETDNSITCNKCACVIYANDIMNGEPHFCPNCGAEMR